MNKQRRKTLADIATRIEKLSALAILDFNKLRDAASELNTEMADIEKVMSDEEDAFDNLPEGLQESKRYAYDDFTEAAQAAVDTIGDLLALTRDEYDADDVEQLFVDSADSLTGAQD